MRALSLCFLVLASLVAGCSNHNDESHHGRDDGMSCTAIGCTDQVSITLASFGDVTHGEKVSVRACAGTSCADFEAEGTKCAALTSSTSRGVCQVDSAGRLTVTLADDLFTGESSTTHTVALSVRQAGKTSPLYTRSEARTFDVAQPNGPQCGPICQQSSMAW